MRGRHSLELPVHEELSKLARDDPEAYEAFRREIIERFIDNAPARLRHRLSGIQFRVDGLRQLSRSALGSTVRIYELMWKSFLDMNHEWQDFSHMKDHWLSGETSIAAAGHRPSGNARILEFQPRLPAKD